ncbi:MAG: CobW family GTP-binding protein, partial [Ktedonobacteraceae bacterium]
MTAKCPVTIVTGFLGSGKTTLLARMLAEPAMHNTAVLVNEFGKTGLDHHLLRQVNEQTVLLGNGCACCTLREDLVKTLLDLFALGERGALSRLERVVIETSGLADPAPILYTIFTHPVLQHHFAIDRVITTVDAINGRLHLGRHPESLQQVAAADTLIVTKSDLASPQEVETLTAYLHMLNPSAHMTQSIFGEIDRIAQFSLSAVMHPDGENAARFATVSSPSQPGARNVEDHLAETHSCTLTMHESLDWRAFGLWLSMLLHARGENILRVKGLLDVGENGPVSLNGVQHIIHPPDHLERWPDDDHS